MSHHHTPQSSDPKVQAYLEKTARRDRTVDHIFRRALHYIERVIAIITIVALLTALALEIYEMFTTVGYFNDTHNILHNLLTIVVGLEFVRMLIDTTPANILEVLTVAITRHVVLTHEDPVSNLMSVACIAGLFAIRRFLIPREELGVELTDVEAPEEE